MDPMMPPLPPRPGVMGVPAGGPMPMAGPPPPTAPPPGAPAPMGPPPQLPPMDLEPYLEELKPLYPAWQLDKDGKNILAKKKPSDGYIDAAIESDHRRHADLVNRMLEDIEWFRNEQADVFEDYDQSDIEEFRIADVPTAVQKICNMVHAIDEIYEWAYCNQQEMEDSQLLEDFSRWIVEQLTIQYAMTGSTLLKWDWTWYLLVYGRIVTRVLPAIEDKDFPWDVTHLDPATVFPYWSNTKMGMERCSLIYNGTVDEAIHRFGHLTKGFTKKVLSKHKDDEGRPQLDHVGEFREYYDGWYRRVTFDGITCLPTTAHELGYVPIVYTVGPGEAGAAIAPATRRANRMDVRDGVLVGSTLEPKDLASKGVCFWHHLKPTLKQTERVLSLAMTTAKQRINPPIGIESPYDGPVKEVDFRTGAATKLRPGEKFVPLLNGVQPADLSILLAKLKEDLSKGSLPDAVFGTIDHSNVSGFAANSMTAAAKDMVLPVMRTIETHLASVIDMMLRQYRDVGHLARPEMPVSSYGRYTSGVYGSGSGMPQPQAQMLVQMVQALGQGDPSGMAAAFNSPALSSGMPDRQPEPRVVTRDTIIRMGSRPKVTLESLALQDKTAIANFVQMVTEAKLMSRHRGMSELLIKNPEKEWQQIISEDAQTSPKMLELVTFPDMLWRNGDVGRFIAYFATTVWPQLMQIMMTGGLPPGGDPAAGAADPTQPPAPSSPQTVQGSSQPMVNQGPGPGSGPQGPVGPPDPTAGGGIQ